MIQMTPEEYRQKYGVLPPTSLSQQSGSPSVPMRTMTQDEYNAKYNPTAPKPFKFDVPEPEWARQNRITQYKQEAEQAQKEADKYKGASAFLKYPLEFGKALVENLVPGTVNVGEDINQIRETNALPVLLEAQNSNMTTQTMLIKKIREVEEKGGDATKFKQLYNQAVDDGQKLKSQIDPATIQPSALKVSADLSMMAIELLSFGTYGKGATAGMQSGKLAPKFSTLPSAIQAIRNQANAPAGLFTKKGLTRLAEGGIFGYSYDVALGLAGERGKEREGSRAFIPGTVTALGLGFPGLISGSRSLRNIATKAGREERAIERNIAGLNELEKNNSVVRNAFNNFRERYQLDPTSIIARSSALNDAVDENGTISMRNALSELQDLIDQEDSVVGDTLKKSNESISGPQYVGELFDGFRNTRLQLGDNLALKKEIRKLADNVGQFTDSRGNIALWRIHQAKIDLGQKIGKKWNNPEKDLINKELYHIYQKTIEKYAKDMDVQTHNRGLSQAYGLRDVLTVLNGKKVEGGRLGKHVSGGIGAIIGATTGNPFVSLAGAQAGRYLKGQQMKRALGGAIKAPLLKRVPTPKKPVSTSRPKVETMKPRTLVTKIKDTVNTERAQVRSMVRQTGEKGSIGGEGAKPEPERKLPVSANETTLNAFKASKNQVEVTKAHGKTYELGDFGRNAIQRKAGKQDRFPEAEVKTAIDNAFLVLRSGKDKNSYRYGNRVYISKHGDGFRAVYTRTNARGAEEIINWHEIPAENMAKYLEDIGISDGTRTRMTSLEGSQFVRLAYGDDLTVPQQLEKINASDVNQELLINEKMQFGYRKQDGSIQVIGSLGELSPELRQRFLAFKQRIAQKDATVLPELRTLLQDAQAEFIIKGEKKAVPTTPPLYAKDAVRLGLAPGKGIVKTAYDDAIETADKLLKRGKFKEAQQAYNEAVGRAGEVIKTRFKDTGISVQIHGTAFGRYDTFEPSIDVTAKYPPEKEDLFYKIITDIAEKDFNQKSYLAYKPMSSMEGVRFGIKDKKKGLSHEPMLTHTFKKPLTLKQVDAVYKMATEEGLPGFTLRDNNKVLDILHLSAYDKNYEEFIQKATSFQARLEQSFGVPEVSQLHASETRFVGYQNGEALGVYADYTRSFQRAYPDYLKGSFDSKVLDVLRYKDRVTKAQVAEIASRPSISPTEQETWKAILSKVKDGPVDINKTLVPLFKKYTISMETEWDSNNASYGLSRAFPNDSIYSDTDVRYTPKGKLEKDVLHANVLLFGAKDVNLPVQSTHFSKLKPGQFGWARFFRKVTGDSEIDTITELQLDRFQRASNEDSFKSIKGTETVQEAVDTARRKYNEAQEEVGAIRRYLKSVQNGTDGDSYLTLWMDGKRFIESARDLVREQNLDPTKLYYVDSTVSPRNERLYDVTLKYYDPTVRTDRAVERTFTVSSERSPLSSRNGLGRAGQDVRVFNLEEGDTNSVEYAVSRAKERFDVNLTEQKQRYADAVSYVKEYRKELTRAENKLAELLNSKETEAPSQQEVLEEQFRNFRRDRKYMTRLFEETMEKLMLNQPDAIRVPFPSTMLKIEGFSTPGNRLPRPVYTYVKADGTPGRFGKHVKTKLAVGDVITQINPGDLSPNLEVFDVDGNRVYVAEPGQAKTVRFTQPEVEANMGSGKIILRDAIVASLEKDFSGQFDVSPDMSVMNFVDKLLVATGRETEASLAQATVSEKFKSAYYALSGEMGRDSIFSVGEYVYKPRMKLRAFIEKAIQHREEQGYSSYVRNLVVEKMISDLGYEKIDFKREVLARRDDGTTVSTYEYRVIRPGGRYLQVSQPNSYEPVSDVPWVDVASPSELNSKLGSTRAQIMLNYQHYINDIVPEYQRKVNQVFQEVTDEYGNRFLEYRPDYSQPFPPKTTF